MTCCRAALTPGVVLVTLLLHALAAFGQDPKSCCYTVAPIYQEPQRFQVNISVYSRSAISDYDGVFSVLLDFPDDYMMSDAQPFRAPIGTVTCNPQPVSQGVKSNRFLCETAPETPIFTALFDILTPRLVGEQTPSLENDVSMRDIVCQRKDSCPESQDAFKAFQQQSNPDLVDLGSLGKHPRWKVIVVVASVATAMGIGLWYWNFRGRGFWNSAKQQEQRVASRFAARHRTAFSDKGDEQQRDILLPMSTREAILRDRLTQGALIDKAMQQQDTAKASPTAPNTLVSEILELSRQGSVRRDGVGSVKRKPTTLRNEVHIDTSAPALKSPTSPITIITHPRYPDGTPRSAAYEKDDNTPLHRTATKVMNRKPGRTGNSDDDDTPLSLKRIGMGMNTPRQSRESGGDNEEDAPLSVVRSKTVYNKKVQHLRGLGRLQTSNSNGGSSTWAPKSAI
ncbi:hypothetical protein HK102_005837 [Quaeritorhiza haematococci]|nr:hypothetical protein HK102_005837 [Quaeritorhiza haematococci]